MNEIKVFSGVLSTGSKLVGNGTIELVAVNDLDNQLCHIYTQSKTSYKIGNRINAVGQWRTVRHGTIKQVAFYAVTVLPVQHLLDTDESWLSDLDVSDHQKQQLLDGNCILQQIGVEKEVARKLNVRHRDTLLQTLTKNPFKILEEEGGLSFDAADTFAKGLGLAPTTSDRAVAGVRDILKRQTAITLKEFKQVAINDFCLFWPVVPEILNRMERDQSISIDTASGAEVKIIVNDLEKSKRTSKSVALSTGNVATDMLALREADDSFIWSEVVSIISKHVDCPVATTPNQVMVIDTSAGGQPHELPHKINNLVERIGSNALHCSAVKPKSSTKATVFERYLVGVDCEAPAIVIIEDSHFLDFKKMQFLAQRLQRSVGLILMGDSTYNPAENPLNKLVSSRKVSIVKLKPAV